MRVGWEDVAERQIVGAVVGGGSGFRERMHGDPDKRERQMTANERYRQRMPSQMHANRDKISAGSCATAGKQRKCDVRPVVDGDDRPGFGSGGKKPLGSLKQYLGGGAAFPNLN